MSVIELDRQTPFHSFSLSERFKCRVNRSETDFAAFGNFAFSKNKEFAIESSLV